MNSVTLMGRLTRDPELTYSASGTAMVKFTLAVDKSLSREKKQEMESRNQPTADFLNIVCWGALAESVNNFTAKGKRVLVQGRIQTGSYEGKDGVRRYTTDINASSVEFIDWKDRDGGYSAPRQNNYPSNNAAAPQRNAAPANDFLGGDFEKVDDDRIPF